MKNWLLQMGHRKVILTFLVFLFLGASGLLAEYVFFFGYFPLLSLVFIGLLLLAFSFIVYLALFYQLRLHKLEVRQHYHNTELREQLERWMQPRSWMPNTRHWAASPDFLKLIVQEVLQQQPDVVLELGSGVSTLYTAYALEKNGKGKLYTVEHQADYAREMTRQLEQHGLEKWVKMIHAPLTGQDIEGRQIHWYQTDFIAGLPSVDLLVVDGPPWKLQRDSRYPAIPLLYERLSPQLTVLVDDYVRADEKRMVQKWRRDYPGFKLTEYLHFDKEAARLEREI